MIVFDKVDTIDESWGIVLYRTDTDGKYSPEFGKAEFGDLIDNNYLQRATELRRLHGELMAGKMSPIGFFTEYQRLDIKDVASRTKLSRSAVKRHMTPAGFAKISVEILERYADVFDISLGEFFQFVFVSEGLSARTEGHCGRLLQDVTLAPAPPGGAPSP